jgi:1-phosphofructokinase family hexose kinase
MVFDGMQPGEVNRAAEVHWCASGKVLNVGQALARLDATCLTLSPIGGSTGQSIEREFAEQEVPCRWVWTKNPTRVCTTLVERCSGRVTELVENAAPLSAAELEAFLEAYREEASSVDIAVLTGSLPSGVAPDFFRVLAELTAGRVVLDIRGLELRQALESRPLVVKPNRAELAATVGRPLTDDADLKAAMQELNRLGATWVLISQRKHAAWLSSLEVVYRIAIPAIPTVNPIGSGDCLAAGLAWGINNGREIPDAVCLGLGAAMENARQLLPARLDASRIQQQAAKLAIEQVL